MATEIVYPVGAVEANRPNPLLGFICEAKAWQDTPQFEFSSTDGFFPPTVEDHMNPILIAFTQGLIDPKGMIRHLRQKKNGRYLASVAIVEENSDFTKKSEKQNIESYSLEKKEELQQQLNDYMIPYDINRIFKFRHANTTTATNGVEFVGYELRQKDTDSTYVDLALAGDIEAFGIIYEDFRERIEKYIKGILFKAGYADNRWLSAEDISQETFIKALHARRRFIKYENVPVAAWLFKIASNLTTSHFRSGHFTQISEFPMDDSPAAPKHGIDENLLLELQVVSQLVEGLSPRQQQIIALTSLGYRQAETAWILNLPSINTLKVLKHKGKVKLREMRLSPGEKKITQFYLVSLAHRLLISRIHRGKNYWQEGQLRATVIQSLNGMGFREYQINSALAELSEDFFDKLANTHTVPR